ncbi:MAG: alpha/beta hydrolase family esterase [Tepidiformaceae bacterium]
MESLESGGVARTYLRHIPPGYDPTVPTPLVFNFHGSSRTGPEQEAYSGLAPVADAEGFILVSPDGLDEQWTIADDGDPAAGQSQDVVFTSDLLAQLRAEFCIDNLRVYATGMSNGAEMASQVGCLLPDDFAAIAPVSGVEYDSCSRAGMPVIAFHGTDDANVPFDTAEPAMAGWAEHNGCSGGPETTAITADVSTESYSGCTGGDVTLYVVQGGGHTWPGAADNVPYGGAGATTHEINASELIWAFFAAHPR